jgi:hypothetical protein
MTRRKDEQGRLLCQWGELSDSPCKNVALWTVMVDGTAVGLSCENCAHNGFKYNVKKSRVQLKSLATGKLITLGELLNVA